ncbi:MAG: phage holin family protein [Bryobacteraceae bacterium]|nr:phage holin family protein [Bryobacteraceae bacterium]
MLRLIVHWLLSAAALLAAAYLIDGFRVATFGTALIAALVIGLVNGTIGNLLKFITFPLTLLTLGLFWIVINAAMLKLAAALVTGFEIAGWIPALLAAVLLSVLNLVIRSLTRKEKDRD